MEHVSAAPFGGLDQYTRETVWRAPLSTKEQREALIALPSGQHGGTYWEIFASLINNVVEPIVALERRRDAATSL
jgi:hypothetical protein